VIDLDAGHAGEQLGGEMHARSGAGRREGELARFCFASAISSAIECTGTALLTSTTLLLDAIKPTGAKSLRGS